jgi:hypothetical protein
VIEKQQKYKRFIYPALQVQYDDFESLSKKALEKGLNYFTQGYIHNIKISEARGAMRVDARCWRSMGIYCLSFELALKLYERKTTKI